MIVVDVCKAKNKQNHVELFQCIEINRDDFNERTWMGGRSGDFILCCIGIYEFWSDQSEKTVEGIFEYLNGFNWINLVTMWNIRNCMRMSQILMEEHLIVRSRSIDREEIPKFF